MTKYLLFILIILSVPIKVFSQEKDTVDYVGLKGYGVTAKGQPDGFWTYWNDNGTKSSEGNYINGVVNGTWKNYDGQGRLYLIAHYDMGFPSGSWEVFFSGGINVPSYYYGKLGIEELTAGNTIAAIGYLNKAIELDKSDFISLAFRAMSLASLDSLELAISDMDKVIILDTNADTYKKRGEMYFGLGNYELALRDLNNSISLNPEDGDNYIIRGIIQEELGNNLEKACEDFQIAKKLGTEHYDINEYVVKCQ